MKIALITTAPTFNEAKRIQEEVKNLGHEPILIDLSKSSFVIENGNIDLNPLSTLNANLVIVRGVFQFIKELVPFIEYWRKKGIKVFDNNLVGHKYAINKVVDIIQLGLNGVKTPKTCYSRNFDDFYKFAEELNYPFILKNTNKGKGAGVYKIDSKENLEEIIRISLEAGKKANGFLLQEFIKYVHDLRVLIIGENVYAMKRIPKKGEFRANFSLGGDVEIFEIDEEIKSFAMNALKILNMSVAGVDVLIAEDDQKYILEVNHTPGFTGMELAQKQNIGIKFVEHAIKNAI